MLEDAIVISPNNSVDSSPSLPACANKPVFDEPWATLHNFQTWRTDPNTYGAWRNDATGYSYDNE